MLEIRRWSYCCCLGSIDQGAGCAEFTHSARSGRQSSHLKKNTTFQSVGLVGLVQVRMEEYR